MDTQRVRQKILDLAIRGKLVEQDPADEPASELLARVRAEKLAMVERGELKPKDVKGDSVIFLGDDNRHYEKVGDKEPVDIEDDLPFELPAGWAWARSGSIALGFNYGVSNSAEDAGAHKMLRITDIQNRAVDWSSVPYTTIDSDKYPKYALENGDIVFARIGATVGKTYLVSDVPTNAVFASYLIKLRPLMCNGSYLIDFFDSPFYWSQITDKSIGSGRPNVNGTLLQKLLIPVPPLAEQRRIVAALDEYLGLVDSVEAGEAALEELASKARAKVLDLAIRGKLVEQDPADEPASELLARVRAEKLAMVERGELKAKDVAGDSVIWRGEDNSYYEKVGDREPASISCATLFDVPDGWTWVRLKQLVSVTGGKTPSTTVGQYWDSPDFPWVTSKDMKRLHISDSQIRISSCAVEMMAVVPSGSILMVTRSGILRRTLPIAIADNDVTINQDLKALTPYIDGVSDYLLVVLIALERVLRTHFHKDGTTVDSIDFDRLVEAPIPIPPHSEQSRICDAVRLILPAFEIQ